jgi:hypothetical protein
MTFDEPAHASHLAGRAASGPISHALRLAAFSTIAMLSSQALRPFLIGRLDRALFGILATPQGEDLIVSIFSRWPSGP